MGKFLLGYETIRLVTNGAEAIVEAWNKPQDTWGVAVSISGLKSVPELVWKVRLERAAIISKIERQ